MTWDLCVLGAGPGGYAAAMRAHDLGKRVVIVERGQVGGAGIHAGALSSKTMWHLSNDYACAARADRGYHSVGGLEVSYPSVIESVRTAVSERRSLLDRQLAHLAIPSANGGIVTLVRGSARFTSPTTVEVKRHDGGVESIEATNFVIATGSRPRVPDGIPVDGEYVVTSDQIESFPSFPESMVIVGAGVVGCEYATIFANYGKTKIHIIDRQPRILPFEDEDVAEEVASSFESMGVVIHRASRLETLKVADGKVEYVITNAEGKLETIRVERALVSVGRIPNTVDLGLEAAGVKLDKSGGITVENTRSSVPHIYAAGDTTMDIALVNVAELEGRYAVESMFGLAPRPIRYEALSAIMFLKPEVASVGLNEIKAREQKIPYRVGVVANRHARDARLHQGARLARYASHPRPAGGGAGGLEHHPGHRVPDRPGGDARGHRPLRPPSPGDHRGRPGVRADAARTLGDEGRRLRARRPAPLRRRLSPARRRATLAARPASKLDPPRRRA